MSDGASAARSSGDTLTDMAAILVDAGATHLSALQAANVLHQGGSINDAWEHIEIAATPARFDAELLAAEVARQRELVLAGAGA